MSCIIHIICYVILCTNVPIIIVIKIPIMMSYYALSLHHKIIKIYKIICPMEFLPGVL